MIKSAVYPQLPHILKTMESLRPQQSPHLNQKIFAMGLMFHKYRLTTHNDMKYAYDLLSNFDELVAQGLITEMQRQTLLRLVFQYPIHQKTFQHQHLRIQIDKLVDQFLSGGTVQQKVEGPSQIPKKESMDKESQKLIKQLLEQNIYTLPQTQKKEGMDQESEKLIKKLLEQEKVNREKQTLQNINPTYEKDCPICLQPIEFVDIAILSCKNVFHRECINKTFTQKIDDRQFPITCPDCSKELPPSDVVQYLENSYVTKYENYSFNSYVEKHNDQMSWCPTAGCSYVFSYDNNSVEFGCPICRKIYCLKCRVDYHTGMTCKEFEVNRRFDKNDQQFIAFVKGAKYKQCPKCKFWVSKNQGCDHMTCRCKFEFCYICGGVYQQCECMKKGGSRNLFAPVNNNNNRNTGLLDMFSNLFTRNNEANNNPNTAVNNNNGNGVTVPNYNPGSLFNSPPSSNNALNAPNTNIFANNNNNLFNNNRAQTNNLQRDYRQLQMSSLRIIQPPKTTTTSNNNNSLFRKS